jgi:two-component system LytT family sensor kinase
MSKNKLILFFHVLFWAQNFIRNILFSWHDSLIEIMFDQLLIATMCYINYFYLFPYILKKNKPVYYFIWALLFIGGFTIIYSTWTISLPYIFEISEVKPNWIIYATSFEISFLYGAMSSGSRLAVDWSVNQIRNQELFIQKTNSKIQRIKSNINIPFMLETLSYSEKLATQNPKLAGEPIMLLSNFLRYGLYESDTDKIYLEREIEIINDYITLQNNVDTSVKFEVNINTYSSNLLVPPNTLLRLISLWQSSLKNNINKLQKIQINELNKTIELKLPLNGNNFNIIKEIEKQFPTFSNEYFSMNYVHDHHFFSVQIKTLNQ